MDPIHREVWTVNPKGDGFLPTVLQFYQEQSEIVTVWKVVEDGSIADDE